MRWHLGPPPEDPDFHPERDGWQKLREPDPILLQVIAAPVALINLAVLSLVWTGLAFLQPATAQSADTMSDGDLRQAIAISAYVLAVIVGIPLLIAFHELLHALAFPGGWRCGRTLIGAWPSRLLFYAAHLGPMTRNRFLWVYFLPFLVLTIIPLLVAVVMQTTPYVLAGASILNAVFACGDQVGMALVAWQVPRTATVQNQGWRTWWKLPGQSAIWIE